MNRRLDTSGSRGAAFYVLPGTPKERRALATITAIPPHEFVEGSQEQVPQSSVPATICTNEEDVAEVTFLFVFLR